MTGEKNNNRTHEQLWNLDDKDLSTPQHDELVLQLLNETNARSFYSLITWDDTADKRMMIESEIPITTKTNFIIGYVDVVIGCIGYNKSVYVEVKPKIKSFGETLRQIRTYMNYKNFNVIYVIYSPDTRFIKAFQSQGILFITPQDLKIDLNTIE